MNQGISRRTVLKGFGAAVALPWLEAFASAAPVAATKAAAPVRAAFLYVPNGIWMSSWTPAEVGKEFKLSETLEPLAPFRKYVNVLSGLTLDKARPNGDGPGDHARAQASFLTGKQARKTNGADIRVGQSADQWIAQNIGDQTKFSSLELGIEKGQAVGNCDSGYSCAYQSNFSWRGENTPNAKEVDPRQVFDRLFGRGGKEKDENRAQRDLYNKSILDFVAEDAKSLEKELGTTDRHKLDEYLTGVREIEARIERAKRVKESETTFKPDMRTPTGIPKEVQDHIRLMCDLTVLAFQADLTRVVTLPFANDGSNRPYPVIGVKDGHHDTSHHGGDKAKHEKLKKINHFHIEQLAYFLEKMHSVKEGEKTLLDSVGVVYGSGIGDGNRHNHDDLPILLLGGMGGTLEGGRHMQFPKETPLMNLYLAMFERLGCPTRSFGDSTGVLKI